MSCWQIVWLSSQFGWRRQRQRQRHLLPLSNATRQQQLQQQQQQQQQFERHCGNNRQTDRQTHPHGAATAAPSRRPLSPLRAADPLKSFYTNYPHKRYSSPSPPLPTLSLLLAILRLHLLSPEGETFRRQIAFNHCKMQEEILLEASKERKTDGRRDTETDKETDRETDTWSWAELSCSLCHV